jgi:zinc transporter ZupT
MGVEPIFLAWGLSSIHFIAALWSLTLAQKKELIPSMWLVFGGGGLRMLIMVASIVIMMIYKPQWMTVYCLTLLAGFMFYLVIEMVVIHKLGLIQEKLSRN